MCEQLFNNNIIINQMYVCIVSCVLYFVLMAFSINCFKIGTTEWKETPAGGYGLQGLG